MAHIFDPNSTAPAAAAPVPASPTSEDSVETGEGPAVKISRMGRAFKSMKDDVEVDDAAAPLLIQSFLTGMIDGAVYNVLSVWQGFMTGNIILVASNIAEYIYPDSPIHPLQFLERGVALAAFFFGAFLGGRIGEWWGPKCRGWHVTTCLIQGALLGGAAGLVFAQPKPLKENYSWGPGVLAMTSTAMGMQAISSARLASPAFATTTAFTAALTQVAADPMLFRLPSKKTRTRDWRIIAISALALGGGVGRTIVLKLGLDWAFVFMVGFKVLVAFRWWFIERKPGHKK